MKLVDILAGGLKDWPEGVAGITQGPGSGVLFDSSYQGFGRDIYLPVADDAGCPASCVKPGVTVSRAEWQAAVDGVNAPKVVEWDGEGLPPVVLKVEGLIEGNGDWREITLKYRSLDFSVFERDDGEEFPLWNPQHSNFRPIRTAEQVASDERDAKAKELYLTINWNDVGSTWDCMRPSRKEDYLKAIDAGYRKEKKPCGS